MSPLRQTLFHSRHLDLGAKLVEFAGWEMPLQYPSGIIAEHLATRRHAGLFDVSHMGRFAVRGPEALPFLQHVLSNNAAALDVGMAQYTVIPTPDGGALDDAYLYRFVADEYLLVVNAANRDTDWRYFAQHLPAFAGVELVDRTDETVMLSLQGPDSRAILQGLITEGRPPEPLRNYLSSAHVDGAPVMLARTGYTGEPLCFELFAAREHGLALWDKLVAAGAEPVGLGARDTLRLEAGLPLYGHELGTDPDGHEIPVFAVSLAPMAVSFSPLKGEFVGRQSLARQQAAYGRILARDFSDLAALPRRVVPLAVVGRGIARQGDAVSHEGEPAGWVTSGTAVPYWGVAGQGVLQAQTSEHKLRAIGLAYLDSRLLENDVVTVDVRGKLVEAAVAPYHLRSDAPPAARVILYGREAAAPEVEATAPPAADPSAKVGRLLQRALDNHTWRQTECINLIPSEMTVSPLVRLLATTDPSFRYAEHKKTEAFYEADVFYYQGTAFIYEVERLLDQEMRTFLGCPAVETRLISGQMANMAVYSAVVDYINRADRKAEPRRIRRVMNNHIGKGGHLSHQPMGALKDFVARDPRTELPAVVNFPVLAENHYKTDVPKALELIEQYRPELIVFGKSMVLHPEPVAEVRRFLDERGIPALVLYDMAHVLGLLGPHFQHPFDEGVDLVTGSTHKTFFGPQRGVVGARFREADERYELWRALQRRTFPGSVSNHHLGTLLALLMAAYEMNRFRDDYQPAVLANAKAFARALADAGLHVAGDPAVDYTETHQVVVEVGYGRGPDFAGDLEANNIICNFQAAPDEEGFTAAGALRLGVAEMTRFGMRPADFAELAGLVRDVIVEGADVKAKVVALRRRFLEMRYCFAPAEFGAVLAKLRATL